jgi:hypothetical protein
MHRRDGVDSARHTTAPVTITAPLSRTLEDLTQLFLGLCYTPFGGQVAHSAQMHAAVVIALSVTYGHDIAGLPQRDHPLDELRARGMMSR